MHHKCDEYSTKKEIMDDGVARYAYTQQRTSRRSWMLHSKTTCGLQLAFLPRGSSSCPSCCTASLATSWKTVHCWTRCATSFQHRRSRSFWIVCSSAADGFSIRATLLWCHLISRFGICFQEMLARNCSTRLCLPFSQATHFILAKDACHSCLPLNTLLG